MSESLHPVAPHHLPAFITAPGDTDILMVVVGLVLIASVLMVGNLYLHTLPERMAHKSQKLQFEIVAVLGLLALFTHIHLFWVVGLLLAMVDLPGGEQLVEARQVVAPGTILTFLEPIYKGGLDGVTRGSSCIVNAYTSNHELIASKETGAFKGFALHAVDAVGLVHATLLRVQALLLPVKTLVMSGH